MKAKPLVGVNLGGWLVLEKWITPSLFKNTSAKDEYMFCKQANAQQLLQLKKFRDTFITKQDFEWLAAQGVEAVRLPVGYWMFGGAPPYLPTITYVDKAFQWAGETGIQILIDLHGAPGSQNGKEHSGHRGAVGWDRDGSHVDKTLEVIRKLTIRFGRHPALLGISLLNEPAGSISKASLLDYYDKAYKIIRDACGDEVRVVYSDAYNPSQWRKELPRSKYKNVYIDTHYYQVFSPKDKMVPLWFSLLRARFWLPYSLARLRKYHPVVVGEWSLALGSSGLRKRTAADQQKIARRYGRLQAKAYKSTAAHFFWTYKTEAGGDWSFRDSIENDLLS